MAHEVTIGGQRLGNGNKNKVYLREYERSTHDLSFLWRSTIASGTLVPFMTEVALPGDTHDIDLDVDVLTHPTIGPLFGSYKIQLDVFQIPIRLYQGKLHMNMLGIGMDMSQIILPKIGMYAAKIDPTKPVDNQQINQSCIFSYLGMRGVGRIDDTSQPGGAAYRKFNAIPYLGYWDIYKNYYANKQEEIGAVIHTPPTPAPITVTAVQAISSLEQENLPIIDDPTGVIITIQEDLRIVVVGTGITENTDTWQVMWKVATPPISLDPQTLPIQQTFNTAEIDVANQQIVYSNTYWTNGADVTVHHVFAQPVNEDEINYDVEPNIRTFPLSNIDEVRKQILTDVNAAEYIISANSFEPYSLPLKQQLVNTTYIFSKQFSQEGLALKTYNSDLFNNWISTEWIDGTNGISEVTAIDTSAGSFTIDELNMSKKIYDMLNRIALSGGSYDDWLDAVYTHERQRSTESPVYLGGLIRNLVFQEVISNSRSLDQPLGTLAGRGTLGSKSKGGKIVVKTSEPSYIMGIASLTPNIDYSQGNKWDTNLHTMNDFHKPALDEIGFQDLITDQMAWFDTVVSTPGGDPIVFKSAGKQPAWINYMTNVNVTRGNFADQTQQMFMTLNRRYEANLSPTGGIKDLTTYIDPAKFNHIFADTRRDAQNFWMQIGVNIEARRKMSAKVIPNL